MEDEFTPVPGSLGGSFPVSIRPSVSTDATQPMARYAERIDMVLEKRVEEHEVPQRAGLCHRGQACGLPSHRKDQRSWLWMR